MTKSDKASKPGYEPVNFYVKTENYAKWAKAYFKIRDLLIHEIDVPRKVIKQFIDLMEHNSIVDMMLTVPVVARVTY